MPFINGRIPARQIPKARLEIIDDEPIDGHPAPRDRREN
jgi:hypothetical protein